MIYTLKQFAELFHTTEHTIRYYTDIDLLPCLRDHGNRRIFNEESVNWMQGISYLKRCGASIADIKKYCALCRLPESSETLYERYQIILRLQEQAHKCMEDAKATVAYMDKKAEHYKQILSGLIPDDSNPIYWSDNPKRKKKDIENP